MRKPTSGVLRSLATILILETAGDGDGDEDEDDDNDVWLPPSS